MDIANIKNFLAGLITPRAEGATVTEIFLDNELTPLITNSEDLEKWHEAVRSLGLEGQAALTKEGKSPIPFLPMNAGMVKVYGVLCPKVMKVEKYAGSAMPQRVLDAIALCKRENYFHEIEVWSDDQKPDPIVVGIFLENPDHSWDKTLYLIARWGDELRSFAELRAQAIKRYTEDKRTKLTIGIKGYQRQLEELDARVLEDFRGTGRGFETHYV